MPFRIPRLSLFLALLLAACGSSEKGSGNGPTTQIHEDVRVLSPSSRESVRSFDLDLESGAGSLRFDANDPEAAKIDVGHIVVSEPLEGVAPYGFLQRVEAKRIEGGEIVLETTQATLEEALEEAEIEFQISLKPEDLGETTTMYQGITAGPNDIDSITQGAGFDFSVDFDEVVIDLDEDHSTTHDQIRINGRIDFAVAIDAHLEIVSLTKLLPIPTLDQFHFYADLQEAVDITIEGALDTVFDEEREVARFKFGTVPIKVGPVPVVFSVEIPITVGARGEFQAEISATASQSLDLQVGVEFNQEDRWSKLGEIDHDFDFPTPTIIAEGSAYAFAKPAVELSLFGISGPFAYARAYVETEAARDRDPFWELTAGVDGAAGFEADLPVIGTLANWRAEFELLRLSLSTAPNEPPSLEVLDPADGARLLDGDRLEFRVRTNDRENPTVALTLREVGSPDTLHSTTARRDQVVTFNTAPLCPGTYEFEVTATDALKASTTVTRTVVVENRIPEVSLREDLLEGVDVFPGGYLTAFATAVDRGCEAEGNIARAELIEWYLNDIWVGEGDRLFYRLPETHAAGETLTLDARYDDGTDLGVSDPVELTVQTKPVGLDLPPTTFILAPRDGGSYAGYTTWQLEGQGVDMEDGILGPESLRWELTLTGPNSTVVELPGTATSFNISDLFNLDHAAGRNVIFRLIATDSAGQEGASTATISVTVPL